MDSFIQTIKKLRQDKGITQISVAESLGISRSSYIAIEQGTRDVSLQEAWILAGVFGITLEKLVSNNDEDQKKYEQMLFHFLRQEQGDKKVTKTKLAKLLYLADFGWYYNTFKSMSGLSYRKIAHGPVPDYYFRLIEELEGDGKIKIDMKKDALLLSETRTGQKVSDSLLSQDEKMFMKKVSKRWNGKSTKEIVDFTHDQIPYTFADKGDIIPYELITQEDPNHVY